MANRSKTRRLSGPLARGLALATGFSLLAATPAAAQWFGSNGPMPPGAIMRALMQQGFAEIGRPRFDGRVYVVEGVNARGVPVRLVIDAYDGGVLSRTRLETPLMPPRGIGPLRERGGDRFEEAKEFAPPGRIPGPGRYDPREAEPRRAERLESFELRRTEPRRFDRPDGYDPRETESRRVERPDQRPTRAARGEPPALESPPNPAQAPARAATRAPAEPQSGAAPVEVSPPPVKAPDTPATTAAITPAPPAAAKAEIAAPPVAPVTPPPAPDPARPANRALPGDAPATEPPRRTVRVIEGVTPVGPPPAEPPKAGTREPRPAARPE
jgi:hypothetical protein